MSSAPPVPARDLFLSRQTSWLDFNRRVLELACDPDLPLQERLRFLVISAQNLDGFFMKRIGALVREADSGLPREAPWPLTAAEELQRVTDEVRRMQTAQIEVLRADLLPALAAAGVRLYDYADLDQADRRVVDRHFEAQVFPVLTPLAVDPGRPFPYISNLSLSLAVVLQYDDGAPLFARVKVPANRQRLVALGDGRSFVPLEQVIAHHLDQLFRRMTVAGAHAFRVTRSADVAQDDAAADDLLGFAVETVRGRKFAPVVRLELDAAMPDDPRQLLVAELGLQDQEVFEVDGLLDLSCLSAILAVDLPAQSRPAWQPCPHPRLPADAEDPGAVFAAIRERDIVVHHPYHDYDQTVVSFVQAAAADRDVVAIKQCLYRTSPESKCLEALLSAAESGKEVTALLELKARLDEAANIAWVRRLEGSGVNKTYGLPGIKTHTRMILVVRQEDEELRRYVHLATGDYNDLTARSYCDLGLFTASPDLSADVIDLFNFLTSYADVPAYRKLAVAPTDLRQRFLADIAAEVEHQRAGRGGRIVAMMNALVDVELALALIDASRAGVAVDLIIRGECCLRPGVPGQTDQLRVRSVLGPFLEHARLMRFGNGGADRVYLASADWMYRNLDHRVEVAVPIEEPTARAELIELLELYLADTATTWLLQPDGRWERRRPAAGVAPWSVQDELQRRARAAVPEEA
ncbi:MAG: polyphosphate kinase 1 [Fimbriimonadaceae bacterium]|nr:polyphosphate kinase 1 [Fimbriimonadaceae bacterium]